MAHRISLPTSNFHTNGYSSLPYLLLVFLSFRASHAVTITMDENLPTSNTITCENIPPGICCMAITFPHTCYFNPFRPTSARFDDLLANDVAAVWGLRNDIRDRTNPIRDCSGQPIETRTGTVGSWYYPAPGTQRAYGASYIRLPLQTPPFKRESQWLEVEGMLGFVWGGGKWFAQGVETIVMQGVGLRKRREGGRRVVARAEGTAYLRGPQMWRWPDLIMVNGTRYSSLDTDSLRYRSADGAILEMMAAQEPC